MIPNDSGAGASTALRTPAGRARPASRRARHQVHRTMTRRWPGCGLGVRCLWRWCGVPGGRPDLRVAYAGVFLRSLCWAWASGLGGGWARGAPSAGRSGVVSGFGRSGVVSSFGGSGVIVWCLNFQWVGPGLAPGRWRAVRGALFRRRSREPSRRAPVFLDLGELSGIGTRGSSTRGFDLAVTAQRRP